MRKVIVTGANGFVGGAVVRELVSKGIEVLALDMEGNDFNLPKSELVEFVAFSLSDSKALLDKIKDREYDIFYHFAWAGSAGNARADISLQMNNALWTVECLKVAKELGCSRFVNAGSIMEIEAYRATFGDGIKPGFGNIYGSAKLATHTFCKVTASDIGIDYITAIITNAYGVGEKSPRMVNSTIRKCISGESPQFTAGTQNYDFVYIDDVARAFRLIGEKGKPFNEYIIGSSNARPLKAFLLEMKEAIAPDLDFIFGDIPFTGVYLSLEDYDCTKTEADTGFKATISFAEGCKKTRDWWITMEE